LSLSTLQSKDGPSASRRKAVVGACKNYGVVKLFGTKWDVYATGQKNQAVALPVNTPKVGWAAARFALSV
jgi:hypothetical protein